MTRDDRFYAFIVARTSRSRSHIRRICVHKRWLKVSAFVLFAVMGGLLYGFYGLTQQAEHLRIERENQRLREENEKQNSAEWRLNPSDNIRIGFKRQKAQGHGLAALLLVRRTLGFVVREPLSSDTDALVHDFSPSRRAMRALRSAFPLTFIGRTSTARIEVGIM